MKSENHYEKLIECDIVITIMKYIFFDSMDDKLRKISLENKKNLNEIEYQKLKQKMRDIITNLPNEYFFIPKKVMENKIELTKYIKKMMEKKEFEELENTILWELKVREQTKLKDFSKISSRKKFKRKNK